MQEQRERSEAARLSKTEFAQRMARDVDARRRGGANLQAKYLALAEQLPEEIVAECKEKVIEVWRKVEEEFAKRSAAVVAPFKRRKLDPDPEPNKAVSFILSATQPAAAPKREPEPEEEPAPIDQPEPDEPEEEEQEAAQEPRVMLPAVVRPAQLPATWDVALDAMNNRHAIIENYGGKAVIAGWEMSPINPSKQVIVFQGKDSFLLRYSNRSVKKKVPDGKGGVLEMRQQLGAWWLGHRQRRQYRGITFAPGGEGVINERLNIWQGWGVEAKPGDWSLIRAHIKDVLASGNAEFAEYIVRWIAWSIQNPAAPAEVALVLIGEKGVGKGTLVRCLERIFGAHAFQVTSREEVIGKFNSHLENCVLFVADEAYWGGDKRCVGRLQGLITEPKLPIERKGFDLIEVRNYLHVVMLAEPGWVIPAGRYERRYAAFEVGTAKRGDKAYFRALHAQIDNGGAEAMFYDLGSYDLDGWHPRDIPETLLTNPALQKQQS